MCKAIDINTNFYPRPPRGGRLTQLGYDIASLKFLSTPSARRATIVCKVDFTAWNISIHALREEGDLRHRWRVQQCKISIHALREEGDLFHFN